MGELNERILLVLQAQKHLISLVSRAAKSRHRMCHVSSIASASFYDAAGSLSYGMIRILSGPQTDESIEKCGVSCRGFLNSRSLSPPRAGFNIQILAGTYSQVPHCSEYPTLPYALPKACTGGFTRCRAKCR